MARGAIFGSGSRPPDKESPGHTDPEKREEGRSPNFFSALRASVWSKTKEGPSPGSTTDIKNFIFRRAETSGLVKRITAVSLYYNHILNLRHTQSSVCG